MDIQWGMTQDAPSSTERNNNKRKRVDAGHKKKVYELDDESMI